MDEKYLEAMWKIMRENKFEPADDTSSEHICVICKKILINACTAPCGCRFCLDCINKYLKNDKRKCPGNSQLCDFEEIDFNTDIHVNRVINIRISKLSVKCPNVGCQSQVELNMIGDHLRMCEYQPTSCPYLIIGCEDVKLRNDQMSEHLSMEIHPHTKLLMNWIRNSQNETKSMKNDIDKLTTEVEKLNKDNDAMRKQMSRDKEDQEKIIRELKRKEIDNSTEIKLLNDEMCALKNLSRSIKDKRKKLKEKYNQEISQLNEKLNVQNDQIKELEQRCKIAESKCEKIINQSIKSNSLESNMDIISEACEERKRETTETSKSIENIKQIIDKTTFGEFRWSIDNWNERLKNAQSGKEKQFFSESFYSYKNGYKLCLALQPYFANRYLIIYVYIEKGSFDDMLRWPFDLDLELSLMNPETGLPHKTMFGICSTFASDYRKLQKPKIDRNDPINCFNFSLQEFSSNPQLIKDDEISIKLSVKPASIEIETKKFLIDLS